MAWAGITRTYSTTHVVQKHLVWMLSDGHIYFAMRARDDEDWVYYAGNASHALESGQKLTEYATEADAQTNYLTTTRDADGLVVAVLPATMEARYFRLVVETGSAVQITEWIPSIYIVANEIIAGQLLITDYFSDAPSIKVEASGQERIFLGNLGSGVYGIRARDASGNIVLDLTTSGQTLSGWSIDDEKIYKTTAVLSSLGYVSFGGTPPTSYGDNVGAWLGYDTSAAKLSLYSDASNYLQFDGSKVLIKAANFQLDASGNITATNATLSGTMTVTGAGGTVTINSAGITGEDTVLGTTFLLPTNGDPPEFSSGIIKEVIYEIYTSGVIKTSDDPTTDGGFLINNTHAAAYSSDLTPIKLFEVIYSGADEGDFYAGDYANGNAGIFYDHSAAELYLRGSFSVESLFEMPADDDLALLLKFDEGRGTYAYDNSGNGFLGTLTNMGDLNWELGISGFCLHFNGSDEYVSIADSTSSMLDVTAEIMVSAWFKSDVSTASLVSSGWHGGVSKASAWHLGVYGSGSQASWRFAAYIAGTLRYSDFTSTTITAGLWYHVVGVYDGAAITCYVDAVEQGDGGSYSGSLTTNDNAVTIGLLGGTYFDGCIDEIRVYAAAGSINQVRGLYLSPGGSPPPAISADSIQVGVLRAADDSFEIDLTNSAFTISGGAIVFDGDDSSPGVIKFGGSSYDIFFATNAAGSLMGLWPEAGSTTNLYIGFSAATGPFPNSAFNSVVINCNTDFSVITGDDIELTAGNEAFLRSWNSLYDYSRIILNADNTGAYNSLNMRLDVQSSVGVSMMMDMWPSGAKFMRAATAYDTKGLVEIEVGASDAKACLHLHQQDQDQGIIQLEGAVNTDGSTPINDTTGTYTSRGYFRVKVKVDGDATNYTRWIELFERS